MNSTETPDPQKPAPTRCTVGLGACVEYIKTKITEAEKAVKFRDESRKTWRGGTDASWRAVGCVASKSERLKTADSHGRIAIKCRKELQTLQAVLEYLQKGITLADIEKELEERKDMAATGNTDTTG